MANTVVTGMQWGDEGKGKIVDLICPAFDVVVRFQGGDNAGHTVKFGDEHFALHLIPSGILRPDTLCVLGNGMVISPPAFFEEVEGLRGAGIETQGSLFVSDRAQVILPAYGAVDQAREAARGRRKIGTTAKGIGPAYENKVARFGIRVCDLLGPALEARVEQLHGRLHRELGEETPSTAEIVEQARGWGEQLRPYAADTVEQLHRWMGEGKTLLFEGAQGALLDVDFGTYPYVTSSNTCVGGACAGSGVPPGRIDGAVGVLKAYTTRVGEGPFVTELEDDSGEYLRKRGNEFGTTTGRPRRCGWLDLVLARYSAAISGIDSIALTKLDVLDGFEEVKVCNGYRIGGETVQWIPADTTVLSQVEPIYDTLPGWKEETAGCLSYDDLPETAKAYVRYIEAQVGVGVGILSTGPRREETLIRSDDTLHRLTNGALEGE